MQNRSYRPLAPGSVSSRSTEAVRAHALGVSLNSGSEQDMERFIRMDKERLIEGHKREVAILNADIEEWQKLALELWREGCLRRTTTDRLWLTCSVWHSWSRTCTCAISDVNRRNNISAAFEKRLKMVFEVTRVGVVMLR
jgi:hypothetical protein